MTDADGLVAALVQVLGDVEVSTREEGSTGVERVAAMLIAADPTLVCPDPADHALADAVRRLPHFAALHHSFDSGDRWRVYLHRDDVALRLGKYTVAVGRDNPVDAIEEALEHAALEDKP